MKVIKFFLIVYRVSGADERKRGQSLQIPLNTINTGFEFFNFLK